MSAGGYGGQQSTSQGNSFPGPSPWQPLPSSRQPATPMLPAGAGNPGYNPVTPWYRGEGQVNPYTPTQPPNSGLNPLTSQNPQGVPGQGIYGAGGQERPRMSTPNYESPPWQQTNQSQNTTGQASTMAGSVRDPVTGEWSTGAPKAGGGQNIFTGVQPPWGNQVDPRFQTGAGAYGSRPDIGSPGWQTTLRQQALGAGLDPNRYIQDRGLTPMWGGSPQSWETGAGYNAGDSNMGLSELLRRYGGY